MNYNEFKSEMEKIRDSGNNKWFVRDEWGVLYSSHETKADAVERCLDEHYPDFKIRWHSKGCYDAKFGGVHTTYIYAKGLKDAQIKALEWVEGIYYKSHHNPPFGIESFDDYFNQNDESAFYPDEFEEHFKNTQERINDLERGFVSH